MSVICIDFAVALVTREYFFIEIRRFHSSSDSLWQPVIGSSDHLPNIFESAALFKTVSKDNFSDGSV